MRGFIVGVIVGAALVIGGAYYHDSKLPSGAAGAPQQFVNWDTLLGAFGR